MTRRTVAIAGLFVAFYTLGCATTGGSGKRRQRDPQDGPITRAMRAEEHIRADQGGDQSVHILGNGRQVTVDVAPKDGQPLRRLHVAVAGDDNQVVIAVHSAAEVDHLLLASVGQRNQISVTVADHGAVVDSEAFIAGAGDKLQMDGAGQYHCPLMRVRPSGGSALACHKPDAMATTARLQDPATKSH
jgi:hypothetical protein